MVTISVNNVKSQIVGQLDQQVLSALRNKLSAEMVGAFFARQRNPWAGTKYFFTPKTQVFPTGMIHYVRDILDKFHVEWEIVDNRPAVTLGPPLPLHDVTLRDYQDEAVSIAIQRERGILRAGTGAGKSSMLSAIIARTNVKTLVLIHKQDIFYQLISTFERILKVPMGRLEMVNVNLRISPLL
jgi:hypothetical protein